MSQQLLIPAPGIQANFKPDFPVEINQDHPLARFVVFYNWNGVDLAAQGPAAIDHTSKTIDKSGRTNTTAASQINMQWNSPVFGQGDFTMIQYSNPASASAIGAMISQKNDSLGTPYTQINLYANGTYQTGTVSAGIFSISTYDANTVEKNQGMNSNGGMVDGNFHQFIGTRIGTAYTVYRDGVNVSSGTGTAGNWNWYRAGQKLAIGNDGNVTTTSLAMQESYTIILAGYGMTQAEITSIFRNPYQLLRAKQRDLWIPVSSTPSNNLVGTSAETQSASAGLSIAVPMVAASVQMQTASGVASVGIPLTGSATATQSASGALQIAVPLDAQAIQEQAGSGAMSISVTLSGNAIQEGYNTGALTNTASGAVSLVGEADQAQSSSGLLSIGVSPSGASLAVQSASGNLTTLVSLTGSSVQAHQASGGLIVTVNLNAEELQSQSAAASMTLRINLNAESVQQAIAQGYLSNGGILTPDPRYTINALGRSFTVSAKGRAFTVNALGRTFTL